MTKRIFCFAFAVLLCASSFLVFASAAEVTGINLMYDVVLNSSTVYASDSSGDLDLPVVSSYKFSAGDIWYNTKLTYTDALLQNYDEWLGASLKVNITTNVSQYDLSKYNLIFTWTANSDVYSNHGEGVYDEFYDRFDGTLGLDSSNSNLYLPGVDSVNMYNSSITHSGNAMSQEYVITDSSVISKVCSSAFRVRLPFYVLDNTVTVSFSFRFTLVEKTTYPVGDIDLGTPDSYTFDIPMNYSFSSPKTYPCGISDVYRSNGSYNFRDYSDYYNFWSPFTPYYDYKTLLALSRKEKTDIGDSSAWNNSVLDVVSFDIPYTVTLPDNFDLDAQKVEYLFRFRIAGNENQLNWYTLNELCGSLYTQYYDFQPYSIKVGGTSIGYKYFEMKYIDTLHTLEVSLRLTSEDETQRAFIRALLNNTSFRFTFSVDENMHGAFIGICSAGFFLGDAPIVPDSTNNNFSQADIDAAFNRGYNSGLSDGSDKNYVFGFVNGLWSSFNSFYKTVTSGISIGGVTLGAVITSVCIIVILIFVLKKIL